MSASASQLRSIDINLLQEQTEKVEDARLLPILLATVAIAGICVLGWMWFDAKTDASRMQKELERVEAQVKEAQARLAATPTAGAAADFLALPDRLKASRPAVTAVLDNLAKLMPADANINVLTFGESGALKMTGSFASTESLISFMQAAKAAKDFTFVGMSGVTKVPEEGNQIARETDSSYLPVIQATFDLQYNVKSDSKGQETK